MASHQKIHQKIARIQKNLMAMKLPKSGENKFANFKYYELEDILPAIFKECYNQELFLEFSFSLEEAQLKVRNWNEPGESVITSVPMPEIVPLNRGMNIMQSEGSYITYLKRYLLTNLFLIMEKDVVDAIPQNNSVSESVVASDPVQKVREYIHSKDSTLEITPLMINQNRQKMVKTGKLTKEESKIVFEWFKKQEREAKQ
ncbi:MAG: ERF family protein [Methanobrevibacter smithii]